MLKCDNRKIEEGQPPNKKLVSEGDILIKNLAIKQKNVKTSLEEQLSNHKKFLPGYEDVPLQSTGLCTLRDFKKDINLTELIGKLKSAGLTETDIDIYLNGKFHRLQETHKNLNCSIMQERLDKIKDMLRDYSQLFELNFNLKVNKSVVEEISIKPHSLETKLLLFFINNKKEDDISQPMKDIQEINNKIINDLKSSSVETNKSRRKARKLQKRLKGCSKQNSQTLLKEKSEKSMTNVSNIKWDVQEHYITDGLDKKTKKVYTCKNVNYFTVMDEKIININEVKNDRQKKLDIKEIQNIPKFKNYKSGTPSKKLYLKNLAKTTSERSLLDILKNTLHCSDNITLKVMKGKMRGQAFMEFPNTNLAVEALNKINGLVVNNKPLIIEFAKSK